MSLRKTLASSENLTERFADYFTICGLDEVQGLEPHQPSEFETGSLTPLQLSYKPSVLWHFPENDPTNTFEPEGIKMLCMPRGVYLRKHVSKTNKKFHSFLQTREDGTKIYGFVLTFYEIVKNENILLAMETLFKMFDTELLLKSPCRSASTTEKTDEKSETTKRTRSFYSYVRNTDELYASKCICLVMKKPFVTLAKQCLENILHIGLNEIKNNFFVESYIYNVLYEIPSPPPGRTMRYISIDNDPIIIQYPHTNELPYFDYSMKEVLMTLGFENLVDLFTCMLLEHQILFLSSDIHKLMLIAECLTILFFPLLWQHVYVPVLPPSLLHFLDAPVPFIMGLYYETEEEKDRFELPYEGSLCLLDIDTNDIELPQEIPELPARVELISELKAMAKIYGIVPPQGSIKLRSELSKSIEVGLDFNSSYECDSDDSPCGKNSNMGTWPRRKSYLNTFSQNGSFQISPEIKKYSPTNASPLMTRQKLAPSSSPPLTTRKKFVTSNWAGENAPHIHSDPAENGSSSENINEESSPSRAEMNPRLVAMMALAEKVGLNTSDMLKGKGKDSPDSKCRTKDDLYVMSMRAKTVTRHQQHENEFNIVVRELFVNFFTQMLVDYEHFVILPRQTKEDWLNNRGEMQNFDKASFLSDQSQLNLPFITLFVETQGFASLIDMKIMALWEDCDPCLAYFDKRIDKLKVKLGIIRSPIYEKCTSIPSAIETYLERCNHIDHNAAQPHALKTVIKRETSNGYFPVPEKLALEETKRKKSGRIDWRKGDRLQQQNEHNNMLNKVIKAEGQKIKEKLAERVKKYMQESKTISKDTSSISGGAHKTLSAFSDKLLKECKLKTKRLVLLKLGQEAVELGHAGPNTIQIEENTLIASLCDLLERVWSHGVQLRQLEFGKKSAKSQFVQRMRQSKSALWSHLAAFHEKESEHLAAVYGLSDIENVADDMKKLIIASNRQQQQQKKNSLDGFTENLTRAIRSKRPDLDNETLRNRETEQLMEENTPTSLPCSPAMPNIETRRQEELLARIGFLNNLKAVLGMKEIKTDTGYARAWTRLALEKKVLATDLRILLTQKKILKTRYKEYAFVRTEEEMEQFLYHMLSLNAVDFFCFTNGFTNTMMTYKVHIILGKNMGSATTANAWINVEGNIASTGTIGTPKGELEFRFKHKNLGILTALRIGHDNTGISAGWFIEFVAITNEVTGQLYRFPCGRWLAKSQDDGSTERLLIAGILNQKRLNERRQSSTLYLGISDRPPVSHTSTAARTMSSLFSKKLSSSDIQERVADAVNNIVKYFYKDSDDNMTFLLCGEGGFCQALETVFQHGFKSTRLFGKNLFIWDCLEKVNEDYSNVLSSNDLSYVEELRKTFCTAVNTINTTSSIGKDQKFQLLICIGLRDHQLQNWFKLLFDSPITSQMYEVGSFFRDGSLLNFLIDVLEALSDFDVVLDKSVTRGI